MQQSHRIEASVQELGQKDSGLAFLNDVRNHRCLMSEMRCTVRTACHHTRSLWCVKYLGHRSMCAVLVRRWHLG